MGLEERSDKLDEQMAAHPAEESIQVLVKDAHRRKRQLRILTVSVILDIILSLVLGFVTWKTNELAQLAQKTEDALIANCEIVNDSRDKQRELWGYVISLTPQQPRTPEQQDRTNNFAEFVDRTFVHRDCQAEAAKNR